MALEWEDTYHGHLLYHPTNNNNFFDDRYIKESGYKSIPNAREEIEAYRDENTRNLTRITAAGHKSSCTFTIRSLHLADKKIVQKWFKDLESLTGGIAKERKIPIRYWNDEENKYKSAYIYRADIEFKIKRITDTDIIYDEFDISLVEY